MNSVFDMIREQLDSDSLSRISRQIGADEMKTSEGLAVSLPVLLEALNRNAERPGGAAALHEALARDHDGSIFNDLGGFLNDPSRADGDGILGHVLGGQRADIENRLAGKTGLDKSSIARLLQIAAPLLLGVLGRKQRQEGFDAGNLSAWLGGQHQMAARSEPGLIGMVTNWLDRNDDGSVFDDLQRIAGNFLGGRRASQ